MALLKTSYRYLLMLGLSLILAHCSVEKNTDATRFYHGMTARYNIYFNGYESYKEGLAKISDSYVDNYAELLNLFEYSDPSTASLCASEMDRAIMKASKLISLKSITSKPEISNKREISEKEKQLLERKEYNEWVDDSYLLISKARFYLHEYDEANSLFNYCITEANDPDIKTEASIWLARVYNETGNYIESNRILSDLAIAEDTPKDLQSMYNTTLADLFIKQKRYAEAIEPLTNAVGQVSGKRTKYRLTYLLAQLNGQIGNGAIATSLYRDVVKMNPPYDVEFNARINIAGVFDVNSGNPREMRRELEKMLKDSKNSDFQDQIYFALGNLSMKEGKEAEAIEFYRKSASSASQNQNQKGKSFLTLADYYYDMPDYMKAGNYYDSAVFFLDEKYPDYMVFRDKSQNLNTLVSQLKVIQVEDSLQKVAMMSAADRNALISSIITQIEKDESQGITSEYSNRANMGQYYENERRFQDNRAVEGKWYFYNQAALTFGRTEFRRRWGDRKMEDNWRRSNRARMNVSQQVSANAEEGEKNDSAALDPSMDYKKAEFYLKNLPLSDSLFAASNERIALAMLNAGKAYSERIADNKRATETLESLISRFPNSDLVPEALFDLYKINKTDNSSKSETYRQKLLQNYPESEFARILSDPGYYEKKMAEMKMAENTYSTAYTLYSGERFNDAITMCDSAMKKFPKDVLAPKFMLLRAYSVARITDERGFKEELSTLIEKWPGTEESKKAEEIIGFLNQQMPELKVEEDQEIAAELYETDSISVHNFVLIITDPAFNINLATFDVISYNIDNFTDKNYRSVGSLVENKYIMIIVSGFSDNAEAMRYYNSFGTGKFVRNPSGVKMITFIIGTENLNVLNSDKNPERYRLFFEENYLK